MSMAVKFSVVIFSTILVYLYALLSHTHCGELTKPRKMIIDSDAGGDDALAIMLALMHETRTRGIEILAITCTYGNTNLENVTQNVLKILTIANRSDIPVYEGAEKPLKNKYESDGFFGDDGFGDFNFTREITAKVDKTKTASELLIELVKEYPDEITIVTLGPLTNIAKAIQSDPNFLLYVKELVIMGSNVPLSSNEAPKIEFNFQQDPESNWITFNNTKKPHTVFPINTVNANPITKEEYRNMYDKLDCEISTFLCLAERKAVEKTEFWEPSDGMTMASVLDPEIITESYLTHLDPVLVGDARGAVVEDSNNPVHNARIVRDIDVDAFKSLISEYLS